MVFSVLLLSATTRLVVKGSLFRSLHSTDAVIELYDRLVDRNLLVRRINITANRLVDEKSVKKEEVYEQLDLFTDYEAQRKKQEEEAAELDREKRMQEAMLSIKKKFGKNAVLVKHSIFFVSVFTFTTLHI